MVKIHLKIAYALCIPRIDEDLDKISIEYYYPEENLRVIDNEGRRLFCGSEFYPSDPCCQFRTVKLGRF